MNKNDLNWLEHAPRSDLSDYPSEQPLPPYPAHLFPEILSKPLYALNHDTQIPFELIANTLLTAASLACQPLIEVIQPHTNTPAPCSLYFFSIAESGAGKSTVKNIIMKPFYEFDERMRYEYRDKRADYDVKTEVWKVKNKTLTKNLRKAIDKNYDGENESRKIVEHGRLKPREPVPPQIIYNDTAATDLIYGLSRYPNAGLITDEAITYFGNRPKNKIGFLNNAWDGSSYHFRRGGTIDCHFTPCLTASLMTQPGVFDSFMEVHGKIFKESGFLSRFLFIKIDNLKHYSAEEIVHRNRLSEIEVFHETLNLLLNKQKERIDENQTAKTQLTLSDKALSLWQKHRDTLLIKIKPGNEFYYIREFAVKASTNALRMATIFQYICSENADEISEDIMENCIGITDWYLNATNRIFFDTPERIELIQNVQNLYRFILSRSNKLKGAITKSEIEQYGPNKLRKVEKLTPVLNHLIGQGDILIYNSELSDTLYISPLNSEDLYPQPRNTPSHIIRTADPTAFRPCFYIDLSDIRLNTK